MWEDLSSRVMEGVIGHLSEEANFYYFTDRTTPIPINIVYSKLQKDMELGSPSSGTYQDSPSGFVRLSDFDIDPNEKDEIEVRGERLVIYKVLKDGEGGATLFLGTKKR